MLSLASLKVHKKTFETLQMSLCKMLKNKKYMVHVSIWSWVIWWEYTWCIRKSWSEKRVYWQFIFTSSWGLLSSSSYEELKIFSFGDGNRTHSKPKMNAQKTSDADAVNMFILCTSIWGCIHHQHLKKFWTSQNTVQVQSKYPLYYFLKYRSF